MACAFLAPVAAVPWTTSLYGHQSKTLGRCDRTRCYDFKLSSRVHASIKKPPLKSGNRNLLSDAMQVYSREKPWWCQPWSILSTGVAIILTSSVIFHGYATIITVLASIAVFVWWYVFLVVYPQQAIGDE